MEPGGVVSPAPPPLAGQTVLVVEDYAINRMIMVNQLRGNGAQVLEAADGDAAVALAAEPGLDLILMDIQMPGKDGIAAIQEIRRVARRRPAADPGVYRQRRQIDPPAHPGGGRGWGVDQTARRSRPRARDPTGAATDDPIDIPG